MSSQTPERILVIVEDCGPGEAICWAECLPALRAAHPDAEMVLLVGEHAAPAFENSMLFDRIEVSDLYSQSRTPPAVRRLARCLRMARLLRRVGRGYDLVLTLGWGTTLLNLLGWLAGRSNFGYSNALPGLLTSQLGAWEVELDMTAQNRRLLAAAGIAVADQPATWSLQADGDDSTVDRLLAEHGVQASPLVVLHPGSDWACQQWLPERWAKLADGLVEHWQLAPVFTGLAGDEAFIDEIRHGMRHPSTSIAGRTTLGQLQALLTLASLCICVDCVVNDLALAAGTPTVVIAGGASYAHRASSHPVPVVVLERTPAPEREAIRRSKASKTMHACHDYECPLWGLRWVEVEDVRAAIEALFSAEPAERRRAVGAGS